jgi:hypothetical protein
MKHTRVMVLVAIAAAGLAMTEAPQDANAAVVVGIHRPTSTPLASADATRRSKPKKKAVTEEAWAWYMVPFSDPACPGNPDSMYRYVRYVDENQEFVEDLYAGTSTYTCDVYKGATYEQPYYDCLNVTNGCYNREIYP